MRTEAKIQLVTNTVIAGAFIGLFYFTVAQKIEGSTVRRNVRSIFPSVDVPTLPKNIQDPVCQALTSATSQWPAQDNTDVQNSNEVLMQQAKTTMIRLVLAGGAAVFILYLMRNKHETVSAGRVFKNAAWSLAAIAFAECFFFFTVVGNAVYVDQNDVIQMYLHRSLPNETLQKNALTPL